MNAVSPFCVEIELIYADNKAIERKDRQLILRVKVFINAHIVDSGILIN